MIKQYDHYYTFIMLKSQRLKKCSFYNYIELQVYVQFSNKHYMCRSDTLPYLYYLYIQKRSRIEGILMIKHNLYLHLYSFFQHITQFCT